MRIFMTKHLGLNLRNKEGGLRLTFDNYVRAEERDVSGASDEKSEDEVKKVVDNFDLIMKYFRSLSQKTFNEELNKLVRENDFVQIEDMNSLSGVSGYYIMVLDDYCQVYIGISRNMKGRIMEHWSKQVPSRQISLVTKRGVLPIDCFRALDTTRIFVCYGNEENFYDDHMFNTAREDRLIYKFPVDYCLNIATFWGSTEMRLERLKNLESRDLKVYGKSTLTRTIEFLDRVASRRDSK